MPRIYHYCPSITRRDAIGYSLTFLHNAMLAAGIPSFLVCDRNSLRFAPPFTLAFDEFVALRPASDDVVLFHYSFADDNAAAMMETACRKVMVYHNITPGHYFRGVGQDGLADACDRGRAHLGAMRGCFEAVAGDSGYNAAELAEQGYPDPQVVPVFYNDRFFGDGGSGHASFLERRATGQANLVFIGRYVPNKRLDNLIRVAGILKHQMGLPVRLRLHGKVWDRGYFLWLRQLAGELGVEGDVSFEHNQPQADLRASLASADAFVSVSEHEGFMVPLVEAFSSGCPVVALASSAVTETCGPAGCLVRDADLELVAGHVAAIRTDRALRLALIRGGSRRAAAFSSQRTLRKWDMVLRDFIPEPLVAHAHRV